jgi:outer membrane protein assembly factor BamB
MKATCRGIAILVLFILAPASTASAENWPQWRGPFFNGSTTERGLPATFSRTENVLWTAPLPGPAGATPVVWGDRVFVSSPDRKTQKLLALCFDARTGKLLWSRETGQDRRWDRNNNMASPSPLTDGKTAWFYYGTACLFAFDLEGRPLWSRDLQKDHGTNALMFGYSSTPLLYDGRLYVQAIRSKRQNSYGQGPEGTVASYLLAVDPATGKDLWKQDRPTDARDEALEAYTSPIPCTAAGRSEILVCGADYLTGHEAATGKELWRWAGYNLKHINHWRIIPSPVVAEGLVFVSGPKHSTLFAVRPDAAGDLGEKNVAWTFNRQIPDAASILAYQDRLYVLDDDGKTMTCLVPKTGEKKWQLELGGDPVFRASPLGADGKVYCMNEAGEVFVLAAGDEPKLLHRVAMGEGPVCRSSIVAAGGRLFVRTADTLYCIAPAGAR